MSTQIVNQMRKNTFGATSITLEADPANPDDQPADLPITSIVVNIGVTPPASFWGVGTGDGVKFRVIIQRIS